MKKESVRPRSHRSKTPPPVSVADLADLALTPAVMPAAPPPADLSASHAAPLPRPGLVTLAHGGEGSAVTLQAGGWREPEPAAAEEEHAKAHAVPVDGDDISVPPAVEDLDHHFFNSQPPPPSARARIMPDTFADLDVPAPDPLLEHKLSPAVQQRRARLAKYVKAAVGVAAGVCFIAAAVHLGTRRTEAQAAPSAVIAPERGAAASPPPTIAATAATAEAPAATVAAEEAEPAQPETAGADTNAAPVASDDVKADETAPSAGIDVELAKNEKHQSQRALERYDLKTAIEVGEQSVIHDPTDAEAWLILGAAYQTKGKLADAKRCFHACIEQGKGPHRWECYQFPH